MTIWLGFMVVIFVGGILLQRVRLAWQLILLGMVILLITGFYYFAWSF